MASLEKRSEICCIFNSAAKFRPNKVDKKKKIMIFFIFSLDTDVEKKPHM